MEVSGKTSFKPTRGTGKGFSHVKGGGGGSSTSFEVVLMQDTEV